jgi:hypothetical protein
VYCRADLSRTTVLVVALLLTAVPTGAFAREYCSSNAEQAAPRFDRTIVALIGPVTPLLVCRHRRTERI